MSTKVLVTGATGTQGGALVAHLLSSKKLVVRALTRSPESPPAKALAKSGIELAQGSFSDAASLEKALGGVSGAFLATKETAQGKAFINAAKKVALPFLVFVSIEGADRNTGIPDFETRFAIEEYLRASGIPHTIIRPVAYLENLPPRSGVQSFFTLGLFEAALKGKKLQWVSVKDVGWFAARALEDPPKYTGRVISLAGDNLTVSEMQDVYQKVQGGSRPWKARGLGSTLCLLPEDFRKMLEWFSTGGYQADIEEIRKEHPALLTLEQWLRSNNER